MKKTYTCIICPNGCDITVEAEGRQILSVEGNKCAKGEEYVSQEIIAPKRTITTSVAVEGGSCPLASVRLTRAIAKEKDQDRGGRILRPPYSWIPGSVHAFICSFPTVVRWICEPE